jgi:hypothetical protein
MAINPDDVEALLSAPNDRLYDEALLRILNQVDADLAELLAAIEAPSGVTPGTYGNSLSVPVISVDERGRVTDVTAASIPDPVAMAIIFGA